MKKQGLLLIPLLILTFIVVYQIGIRDHETPAPKPAEVKKADIISKLPYTVRVGEDDKKPEIIAYRIWFDLMDQLEKEGAITGKTFTRFTKLSGNENAFVAAVVFQVQLPEGVPKIDYGLGKAQDIVWKLTINKAENQKYTLTKIEKTNDTQIGLPPVETPEQYRKKAGIEEASNSMAYEMKEGKLKITYNHGQKWKDVPVSAGELVINEENGSDQQLMDSSYVINPEITAFLLKGPQVLVSHDKGATWKRVPVAVQLPGLRFQKLGFTSARDGYLIVTGDKTMSSEAHLIFKTKDGGQSWQSTGSVKDVYSLVTDGGFINGHVGFISFGEYRELDKPPVPNLYRTADGGAQWERVQVPIPEEYLGYFTVAEIPVFNGGQGVLLVNQGPQGDYLGGKVLAKFTSNDQGKAWAFTGLVDPDGVLQPK